MMPLWQENLEGSGKAKAEAAKAGDWAEGGAFASPSGRCIPGNIRMDTDAGTWAARWGDGGLGRLDVASRVSR